MEQNNENMKTDNINKYNESIEIWNSCFVFVLFYAWYSNSSLKPQRNDRESFALKSVSVRRWFEGERRLEIQLDNGNYNLLQKQGSIINNDITVAKRDTTKKNTTNTAKTL